MLTAKGQIEDRVTGLDAGADDYLVKPFSTDELLARVRALLRRAERKTKSPVKLKLGEVEIDLARQTAVRGKREIHLTAKEFAMLRLLAEAEGEPVSREKFLDVVWGYTAFPTTRTVDNHVASLRAKLEKNPDAPRWLKTVHGVGYKLELEIMNKETRKPREGRVRVVSWLPGFIMKKSSSSPILQKHDNRPDKIWQAEVVQIMKTKLCLGIFLLAAAMLRAQTNDLTALLQQGLFEEQANRNLDAAIADYSALAKQFDQRPATCGHGGVPAGRMLPRAGPDQRGRRAIPAHPARFFRSNRRSPR